ncbi:Calmodulin [Lachnellula hyalina]|uniref:Calmodulin n=1 Tax=Lachnellula hyalina TaxID=1316788 RepID=A0A8H8TUN4_9HELO|nr:Calmodulin [Lachnellula hyalina]TVY22989.1 Calmodulin [Lachnellula hyalina]
MSGQNATQLTAQQAQDKAALKDAFALFDSDNDGVITKEELGAVMHSLGLQATPSQLEDMINEIDLDHTGTVDLEGKFSPPCYAYSVANANQCAIAVEFIKMMTMEMKPANIEQEMRNAFKVFDKDNSGTISADEIATVMATFGQNLSKDEVQFMVEEVDKNGDGTIDCMPPNPDPLPSNPALWKWYKY